MRRAGFFTAEFYAHLTGVRALPPDRRLGAGGHDQQHRFEVARADRRARRSRRRRRVPLRPDADDPAAQGDAARAVHAVRPPDVRAGPGLRASATPPPRRSCRSCAPSSRACVAAGATFIQIDEPSPAIHPDAPSDFSALFNAAVEPVVGQVRLGAHLCFGNYLGRPLARRTYRPVLDAMLGFTVDELVLEFANREMAEVGDPRRDRRGRPRRRRRRHRRQELLPRDGRRRRRADRRACSRPASRPSA